MTKAKRIVSLKLIRMTTNSLTKFSRAQNNDVSEEPSCQLSAQLGESHGARCGLIHTDANRIIFTFGGVYIWQVWTGGRQVSVMILQLLAFMTHAMATRATRSEIKHRADVVGVRIRNS